MPACTVPATLDSFGAYLTRRGRTPKTRAKYLRWLRQFEAWAGARDAGAISAHEIELLYLGPWHEDFERRHGQAPSAHTVRSHIDALRSYYAFLERFDLLESPNPMRKIDSPKAPRKANDWLMPAEDQALLRAAVTPQERVLIYLLRFSGLRIGEAVALRNRDVDTQTNTITVRASKTPAGRRIVPILPELRREIVLWRSSLLRRRILPDPGGPFLATKNLTPMFPQYAWRVVKRVAESAGIRHVSPHTLRRTFGSDLLNRGVRLEVVSKALGHASTTVTEQSYAELLNATLVNEVLAAMV
jgi:integrase/recombinase XerD